MTTFYAKDPPEYIYIPGGLRVGTSIIIQGKVAYRAKKFAVDLKCNDSDDSNIPFHFNPRLGEGEVVRNSFMEGWGYEERDQPYFPFAHGRHFQIRIHAASDKFKVMVNGRNFIHYRFRTDIREVRYVQLSSGAEYYDVTIQKSVLQSEAAYITCVHGYAFGHDIASSKETNPRNEEIRRPFDVGHAVRVRGTVKDGGESFAINLNFDYEGKAIAFHFNARFNEGEVVRNTNLGGWGKEERHQKHFPFAHGQMFDILFIAQRSCFNVYVNYKFFTTYNYRCDVHDIRYLRALGDASICDVEFFKPLPGDFMKDIPSGLEKSDMIVVKGFFYPEGEKFAINLMNGHSLGDDIGLHFNPRRNEGEVVLNNRCDGSWLEEERVPIPHEFHELLPFEVKIVVNSSKFMIYVNEKKLTSFRSRSNVEDIKKINVTGDAWFYEAKLLQRLEVPVVDTIPSGLREGSWVILNGTAKKHADNFAVNLQCGDSTDYQDDVAFHFNPRFGEGVSVRNALLDGDWGKEERDQPSFPFESKDAFSIAINCQEDRYRLYVNGHHYIDFSHRIDYHNVYHLMLTGDANFFEPEFY